eukprot:scaffold3149_cov157-Pinguiococcus_pyrenoidosus.AAC.1
MLLDERKGLRQDTTNFVFRVWISRALLMLFKIRRQRPLDPVLLTGNFPYNAERQGQAVQTLRQLPSSFKLPLHWIHLIHHKHLRPVLDAERFQRHPVHVSSFEEHVIL